MPAVLPGESILFSCLLKFVPSSFIVVCFLAEKLLHIHNCEKEPFILFSSALVVSFHYQVAVMI